jgi:hypothetical protein
VSDFAAHEERRQADVQDRVVLLVDDRGHRPHEGKVGLSLRLALQVEDADDVGGVLDVGDVEEFVVQHDLAGVGAGEHRDRLVGHRNHLTQARQSRLVDIGGHDAPVG